MLTESTILQDASIIINDEIKKVFAEQGHTLTGAWEDSLSTTSYAPNELEGWAKSYGAIVNAGVTADRIPFGGEGGTLGVGISSGASWAGDEESFHGTSQYIQGLVRFWKLRKPGISDKMALSLAFATAKVQKREGMSTINSQRYSQWGDRQNFVGIAFIQKDEQLADTICGGLAEMVNETLDEPQTINY